VGKQLSTTDLVTAVIWGAQMPLKYFSATEWKGQIKNRILSTWLF